MKRGAGLILQGLTVGALLSTSTAEAHLGLDAPTSRYGRGTLKSPPCGQTGGTRTQNVTTFEAGQTITVQWNEYINHPSHYRIAFDDDGDDDFEDPACLSGCNSRNPVVQMYNNSTVLLDGIADANGGTYTATVTLPDIECNNCTLQVIQVMYDKPPYTIPGNEMYYQCADLVLQRTAPPDAGVVDSGADAGPSEVGTIEVGIADAGASAPDAGAPGVDAGTEDGGVAADAGTALADAGVVVDAGSTAPEVGGGCRCAGTGAATPAWMLLGGVGVLLFARRRRVSLRLGPDARGSRPR